MAEAPVAVQISGLKKRYLLGQFGRGTLIADLKAKLKFKQNSPDAAAAEQDSLDSRVFWALKGIDLTIRKGETLGIIGHNGAGKSTLLKILSRITAPTEGEVVLDGRISSMLEVGTGFMPEMTGRENIYLNGAILGMSRAEINLKMQDIIAFSECGEFIDTPVKRYSSGMYVKLAFSVAAHLDSEIMIMDEVLAVGDAAFQKKCLDRMRIASEGENRTILYVSHNMSTVRRLCRRCVVLEKGRIVFDGDTESAIRQYTNHMALSATEINLAAHTRLDEYIPQGQMLHFQLLGKEDSIYYPDEPVRCALTWKAFQDLENLCFRIIVRTPEGRAVGTASTAQQLHLKAGDTAESRFVIHLNTLAPGLYTFDLAITNVQFGMPHNIDVLRSAIPFEIKQPEIGLDQMEWNHDWWGELAFPPIEVTE